VQGSGQGQLEGTILPLPTKKQISTHVQQRIEVGEFVTGSKRFGMNSKMRQSEQSRQFMNQIMLAEPKIQPPLTNPATGCDPELVPTTRFLNRLSQYCRIARLS
jgi:hypothetical protein